MQSTKSYLIIKVFQAKKKVKFFSYLSVSLEKKYKDNFVSHSFFIL